MHSTHRGSSTLLGRVGCGLYGCSRTALKEARKKRSPGCFFFSLWGSFIDGLGTSTPGASFFVSFFLPNL